MNLLDTHIWIWWVNGDSRLPSQFRARIKQGESDGMGVSIISCWELAKLVENGRLQLNLPVENWIYRALGYPGIQLLPLTPRIVVEACQLPGSFHRDPADQLIVATSRVMGYPLLTQDDRIRNYPHVDTP